ncbi:MgtC/SapB family protein [Halobacillus salinarum]|uniref:MgtC/SapB family protein n=1 Tax=Halobacillus salinarum TaxID=2932257 RepID=A0ABY4EJJ5_9BACI|nr:MgtC/SapB family protein [Halobacillus salinarum]UOQ44650.1 MgtC/SapB family protein [Halobacillus salinarum]
MEWTEMINEHVTIFLSRLLVALVLSGLIGFERELKNHSAGFRTHIMVGVGACLMMLLSLYGFQDFIEEYDNVRFDPARIPSYVISGIGFLGAGSIIVHGSTIRGLTTAASIWTMAGIGLVVGAGMYGLAVLTTVLVLLSLIFLNKLEKQYFGNHMKNHFLVIGERSIQINELLSIFDHYQLSTRRVEIQQEQDGNRRIVIELEKHQEFNDHLLVDQLSQIDHVVSVKHRS